MSHAVGVVGPTRVLDTGRARSEASAVRTTCVTRLEHLEADAGLLHAWGGLVAEDPQASLFQTAGWCMPWYRCYADEYRPHVILVHEGDELVGLIPMAVHRSTGVLVFASHTMADYRDIVARPGYRHAVVDALVRTYLDGDFPNPLQVGWLDPASDTGALVTRACAQRNIRFLVRQQPCYRWFPPAPAKPNAQKFLNWYKRNGTVSFDVIESTEDFAAFREEYYRQHSLRQIQAGRGTVFEDARRVAFYDALFHAGDVQSHLTAFRVDGRMLAGHFGYVWRGVLLFGPPAIRLEDEQRSPAVILLSWIIQNAASLGLSGFDLTLGDSDFKKRLGNRCVPVTQIEIFKDRRTWRLHHARVEAMAIAKGVVATVGGRQAWQERVKPVGAWLQSKGRLVQELGWPGRIGAAGVAVTNLLHERRTTLLLAIRADQLRSSTSAASLNAAPVRENQIEDLLLYRGSSAATSQAITNCARAYARARSGQRSLHTLLVNGRLAAWAFSYRPEGIASLNDPLGTEVEIEPASLVLYDLQVVAEFRPQDAAPALVSAVLAQRFAGGIDRAYLLLQQAEQTMVSALEQIGLGRVRRIECRRLLRRGWKPIASTRNAPEDILAVGHHRAVPPTHESLHSAPTAVRVAGRLFRR